MRGMAELIDLRKRGMRPRSVWVKLVDAPLPWPPMGHNGLLDIEILPTESLADLDFRPLVGLSVTVEDLSGNPARHRKVAKLVAAIKTETLVMPMHDSEGVTLHIRRGETTETHRV